MRLSLTVSVLSLLRLYGQTPAPNFEVASVKLVTGRSGEAAFVRMETNATRVSYSNVTLEFLISIAYKISDKRISGIPSAVQSASYDVAATLPPNASKEQIPLMLQRLLADRLKLSVRREPSTMPAYDLVALPKGPKLELAKPGSSGLNQIVRGEIILSDTPIGTICDTLSRVVGRPVVDKTGIEGRFDFTLTWGPDETGPSTFTTLQEQRGLKLVPSKTTVENLVVTHAERVPTEN